MNKSLSPYEQAIKNIFEKILNNPKITKSTVTSLTVLFGNLTQKTKLTREQKKSDFLFNFDVERTLNEISKIMENSDDLHDVWILNKPIIFQSVI